MATKQKATVQVRIYPKTHKRLKINSARLGISLAEIIDATSFTTLHIPYQSGSGIEPTV